jgi:hypothetical protein
MHVHILYIACIIAFHVSSFPCEVYISPGKGYQRDTVGSIGTTPGKSDRPRCCGMIPRKGTSIMSWDLSPESKIPNALDPDTFPSRVYIRCDTAEGQRDDWTEIDIR